MHGVRVGEPSNPGPVTTRSASRILATQVDSSGIEQEQERSRPVEGRDVRPRRGHRRGLVVEMAPNVVTCRIHQTRVRMIWSWRERCCTPSRKIWWGVRRLLKWIRQHWVLAPEDGFRLGTSLDHGPRLYVCQAPNAFICVSSVALPKHQMRLYVCHQMRLYVCHQMRLYVCHRMRLLMQRSSLRSLTFARFARTFFLTV